MKKNSILCLIIAILMIFSNASVVNASQDNKSIRVGYDNGVRYFETVEKISIEEAQNRLSNSMYAADDSDKTILANRSGGTGFYDVLRVYDYGPFAKSEIGGLFECYNLGSFRQITRNVSVFTRASGSGFHQWNESYVADITPRYPTNSATIRGRGQIEIQIDASVSGSIGTSLLGNGFEFGGSIGTTYYYRRDCIMETVFNFN